MRRRSKALGSALKRKPQFIEMGDFRSRSTPDFLLIVRFSPFTPKAAWTFVLLAAVGI